MYDVFEQLLKARGLNAYKVSKATGISSQTLSAWKQGLYTPKREKMEKIAEYLGVTVEYLMGTVTLQDKYAEEIQKIRKEQKEHTEIQHAFDLLNDANKAMLLEYAEFLLFKQNKKPSI